MTLERGWAWSLSTDVPLNYPVTIAVCGTLVTGTWNNIDSPDKNITTLYNVPEDALNSARSRTNWFAERGYTVDRDLVSFDVSVPDNVEYWDRAELVVAAARKALA